MNSSMSLDLPLTPARRGATVLLSGGQDSCTALVWAQRCFNPVLGIVIRYGQRHVRETEYALRFADRVAAPYVIVDLEGVGSQLDSALTRHDIPINTTGGHHGLPNTFTPGRNLLFLTVAMSLGFARRFKDIVIGVCETDYSGYPDCRAEFIAAFEYTAGRAIEGEIKVHTPLMYLTKAQTFDMAQQLGVFDQIIRNTMTCYEGVETMHDWGRGCAKCPACGLRKQGYEEWLGTAAPVSVP